MTQNLQKVSKGWCHQAMSRPDQEPFIPETEGSGHSQSAERGGHRRQRRQLQQERRRAFRDRHFQDRFQAAPGTHF